MEVMRLVADEEYRSDLHLIIIYEELLFEPSTDHGTNNCLGEVDMVWKLYLGQG